MGCLYENEILLKYSVSLPELSEEIICILIIRNINIKC